MMKKSKQKNNFHSKSDYELNNVRPKSKNKSYHQLQIANKIKC